MLRKFPREVDPLEVYPLHLFPTPYDSMFLLHIIKYDYWYGTDFR
jgi:hypothetical protein